MCSREEWCASMGEICPADTAGDSGEARVISREKASRPADAYHYSMPARVLLKVSADLATHLTRKVGEGEGAFPRKTSRPKEEWNAGIIKKSR